MYCIGLNDGSLARGIIKGLKCANLKHSDRYGYFTLTSDDGKVYHLVCWDESGLPHKQAAKVVRPMLKLMEDLQFDETPHKTFYTDYNLA